jgi:hypothetical protein
MLKEEIIIKLIIFTYHNILTAQLITFTHHNILTAQFTLSIANISIVLRFTHKARNRPSELAVVYYVYGTFVYSMFRSKAKIFR